MTALTKLEIEHGQMRLALTELIANRRDLLKFFATLDAIEALLTKLKEPSS